MTVKISIVEGAPETSKTRVISMTVVIYLSENRKFLGVAETRYAIRVAAEVIFSAMATAGLQQRRVFMIEHVGADSITSNIKEVYADEDEVGVLKGPHFNAANPRNRMSEISRDKIRHELKPTLTT